MAIPRHQKTVRRLLCAAIPLALVAVCWQGLTVRHYTTQTDQVTAPVRLVVLTDLHSSAYGSGQHTLTEVIAAQQPDAILLVGDIADDDRPHDRTETLLAAIAPLYPCYYVAGNHEFRTGEIDAIKEMIAGYGVTVLAGTCDTLTANGQQLTIAGVDDPSGLGKDGTPASDRAFQAQLQQCADAAPPTLYSVLLSHRPERVDDYNAHAFDLIFCGHAHGGQVRIPGLLNGLIAPHQGLFPAYAGGEYALEQSTMIVSRGLSRTWLPRVFNPPELLVVDICPIQP